MKIINLITFPLLKANYVFNTILGKKGLMVMPLAATLPLIVDVKLSIAILFIVMIFDFITGIAASLVEKKKVEKVNPELKSESWISSEKLKRSGGKFFLYASTILLAYLIEKVFFVKSFSVKFTDAQLTITVSVVLWWIAVELYSIFKENLPRAGFDIFAKLSAIIKVFKSTKNQITE